MNTRRPPSPPPRRPQPPPTPMKRWMPAIAAAGVLGVVVFAGFSGGDDPSNAGLARREPRRHRCVAHRAGQHRRRRWWSSPTRRSRRRQLSQTLRKGMYRRRGEGHAAAPEGLRLRSGPHRRSVRQRHRAGAVGVRGAGAATVAYDQQTGELTNELWQTMQDPIVFGPSPAGRRRQHAHGDLPRPAGGHRVHRRQAHAHHAHLVGHRRDRGARSSPRTPTTRAMRCPSR